MKITRKSADVQHKIHPCYDNNDSGNVMLPITCIALCFVNWMSGKKSQDHSKDGNDLEIVFYIPHIFICTGVKLKTFLCTCSRPPEHCHPPQRVFQLYWPFSECLRFTCATVGFIRSVRLRVRFDNKSGINVECQRENV